MRSADLFCCSRNTLLIRRGEGCLINGGGGVGGVGIKNRGATAFSLSIRNMVAEQHEPDLTRSD